MMLTNSNWIELVLRVKFGIKELYIFLQQYLKIMLKGLSKLPKVLEEFGFIGSLDTKTFLFSKLHYVLQCTYPFFQVFN